MSLIREQKMKKLLNSGRIEAIEETVSEVEDVEIVMHAVMSALTNAAGSISATRAMLNAADEEGDVVEMERLASQLEAKLDAIKVSKLGDAVDNLASIFDLKAGKKTNLKEEAKKSLGL